MGDKTTSSPRFTEPGIYDFGNVHFYCLDGVKEAKLPVANGNATPARRPKSSIRDDNVRDIQARLTKYTSFDVTNVRMKQSNNVNTLYNWFLKALSDKKEDDLLIFYYYGLAGGKGVEYSWKFDGAKHVYFNAYDIFQLCGESGLTCVFLLDCDIQTLWEDKLKPPKGHVSIFARGGQLKKPNGEIEQDDASFTGVFTDNLSALAKDTDKKKHALLTIPQLLTPTQFKPTYSIHRMARIFEEPVKRRIMNVVFDPERIREQIKDVEGSKFGEVEAFFRVSTKGNAIHERHHTAQPAPRIVGINPGIQPPPSMQAPAPTAVMMAPSTATASASAVAGKRYASEMSEDDEGYTSDHSADTDGSTLFVSKEKRRRAATPDSM